MKHHLKRDEYRRSRGGRSRFLDIHCSCKTYLLLYQKDGPGDLIRLYYDRIFPDRERATELRCAKCDQLIGTKMIYAREKRPAYLLCPGTFIKSRSDGTVKTKPSRKDAEGRRIIKELVERGTFKNLTPFRGAQE